MCEILNYIKDYFAEIVAIIGVLGTILSAVISSISTKKLVIKQENYKRREGIYFDILSWFEDLRLKPYSIYEETFIMNLVQAKTKMKLFASKNSVKIFEGLYNDIIEIYKNFQTFEREQASTFCIEGTIEKHWQSTDPDDYKEYNHPPTESEILMYECEIKNYKDNNLYSKEVFKGNLDCLYVSIKKDLDIKWGYIYAKIN